MRSLLMIPVKLDALVLADDTSVVAPMADWSALPYSDGTRDYHADTANLSEDVVARPFEEGRVELRAGIHLHWSLPAALTRGLHTREGASFPAVPNRWLVRRSRGAAAPALDAMWVVESDYLHPEGMPNAHAAVAVPVKTDPAAGRRQPFRFQGRAVPLARWQPDSEATYLDELTAVGHGEPWFAAFYPGCRTIFGFHDATAGTTTAGLGYDLIGWYARPKQDPFASFMDALRSGVATGQALTRETVIAAAKERFGWQMALGHDDELPGAMICYARLTWPSEQHAAAEAAPGPAPTITVASTGAEALAAYLAHLIAAAPAVDQAPGARARIEQQIEALQLASRLADRQLDLGPKLAEARHEKGFAAVGGGTRWTVRPVKRGGPAPADAAEGHAQEQITLPESIAHALNRLNLRQADYDASLQQLRSMRRQLFADWYKYMICAYPPAGGRDDYPDPDLVRHFVEQRGLDPIRDREACTGHLELATNPGGAAVAASDSGGVPGSLAAQVADAIAALVAALGALDASEPVIAANVTYTLRPTAAPRFWLPREPVVLLTGADVDPGDRFDGGPIECHVLSTELSVGELLPMNAGPVADAIRAVERTTGSSGISTWRDPWTPLLLQWQLELLPLARGTNLAEEGDAYRPDFLTASYQLGADSPELTLRPGEGALQQRSCIYSGSSILTPQAHRLLLRQLDEYLARSSAEDGSEVRRTLSDARARLADPGFHCLSQALGGFNEALLTRSQTPQLPIGDPLGFEADQAFSDAVRAAVGDSAGTAPEPLVDFQPIRAGALRLVSLRLVDTFGQQRELDCGSVITPEALRIAGDERLIALPPRLVQPAHIAFRWLAADGDEVEMNDHPATTPICGWLLPNNLDGTLLVYDNRGQAQGIIDPVGRWRGLADEPEVPPAEIVNPHLRQLVSYLLGQPAGFLARFQSAIDASLDRIDPESAAQHPELALLMGRPVALVRASLSLELQGPPAVDQCWNAFRRDLARGDRDHAGFASVEIPIRLGDLQQHDDGLVGYWQEGPDGYQGGRFHSPSNLPIDDPQIVTHADDPAPLRQSLDAPPQILSLLVDPRGAVHATSGVLPAKSIRLPPDQFVSALRAIEIAFLTTPILTDRGALKLPLPAEEGRAWEWLSGPAGISAVDQTASFAAPQEIREGWLRLTVATPAGTHTKD